jgi:sec-independent protein translocase protein TatA
MFGGIGVPEMILIFLVLLLLFGAKRIPLIARGLGEGIRNFKGGLKESDRLDDGSDRRKGRDRDDRTS